LRTAVNYDYIHVLFKQPPFLGNTHICLNHIAGRSITILFIFADKIDGFTAAGGNTEAAAYAAVKIYLGNIILYSNGLHLAPLCTDFTTYTVFLADQDIIIGMHEGRRMGEPLETFKYLAAIPAAEAHTVNFLGIGWLQHQGLRFGRLQNIQGLFSAY
jgi:hypothetical protein